MSPSPIVRLGIAVATAALAVGSPTTATGNTVATGYEHSVVVTPGGTVWTWGDNSQGQLGDGMTEDRPVPAPVPVLSDVTAVAAGKYHTLALKADGSVWAWGANDSGQLGDGESDA